MLAGTVETAVNALWDAAPLVGDRVTVVGAGMVGCCVARLLAGFPGVEVDAGRRRRRRGPTSPRRSASTSRCPADAAGERDLVVHTSATSAGLQRSLDLLAPEGTVIELSWYGDAEVDLALGGAFHSRRLAHPRQPGRHGGAGATRPAGRTADRLALALDLLRDPAFDALLTGASPFDELPGRAGRGWPPARCRRSATSITYDEE